MEFSEKTLRKIKELNRLEPHSAVAVDVFCAGETYHASVGNVPCGDKDYFQIGSNTKLFTAALIVKLAEEKKLELTAPISRYLKLNDRYRYPTVEDLLTHHAYRPLPSRKLVWNWLFRRHLLYHNIYEGKNGAALENYLLFKKPPRRLHYFYSDLNYAVLGLIVEKVCGQPFEDALETFIRSDLQLTETSFAPQDGTLLDSYYKKKFSGQMRWQRGDIYRAAGGLYATAGDAFRFLMLVLGGDIPCLNETLKKRKTILFGKLKLGVGFGWHCYINGNYFFHKGGVACFRTNWFVDVKRKICVSVTSNVIGDKFNNTTTIGIGIYKDLKEALKNKPRSL